MPKQSAGLLIYRRRNDRTEVFLVHPGGPFWQNKDAGAWSIPKGEFAPPDDPLEVAQRELREETGYSIDGPFLPLEPSQTKGWQDRPRLGSRRRLRRRKNPKQHFLDGMAATFRPYPRVPRSRPRSVV